MAGGPSANLPVGFLLMPGRGSTERKEPRNPKDQESVMIHDVPRYRPHFFISRYDTHYNNCTRDKYLDNISKTLHVCE